MTKRTVKQKRTGTKRTTTPSAGRLSPPEWKADDFAAGLVADLRARGIKDEGVAFVLTMEADRLVNAARQIVPTPSPQNEPLSAKKSELALEVIRLVEQSFESGEETPGEGDEHVSILREALRSAKGDLRMILAASQHLSEVGFTYEGIRAEARIELALALYKFKTAEEEPAHEAVSRAAEAVQRETDRICAQAKRARKQVIDTSLADQVAS